MVNRQRTLFYGAQNSVSRQLRNLDMTHSLLPWRHHCFCGHLPFRWLVTTVLIGSCSGIRSDFKGLQRCRGDWGFSTVMLTRDKEGRMWPGMHLYTFDLDLDSSRFRLTPFSITYQYWTTRVFPTFQSTCRLAFQSVTWLVIRDSLFRTMRLNRLIDR